MLPWVVCQQRSCVKITRIQIFGAEVGATGAGVNSPGVGVGAGTIGTLNFRPEPEPGTECSIMELEPEPFKTFPAQAVGKGGFANISPAIVLKNLKMKANKRQSRNIFPGESVGVSNIF